jgi:hypothetical protein
MLKAALFSAFYPQSLFVGGRDHWGKCCWRHRYLRHHRGHWRDDATVNLIGVTAIAIAASLGGCVNVGPV